MIPCRVFILKVSNVSPTLIQVITIWNSAQTAAAKAQGCSFPPNSKERNGNQPQRSCSAMLVLRTPVRLF